MHGLEGWDKCKKKPFQELGKPDFLNGRILEILILNQIHFDAISGGYSLNGNGGQEDTSP
jgi:hypothetical protein